jgi:uncharacterized RDD family membrane protein YckC
MRYDMGKRFVAFVIDSVIVGILVSVLKIFFGAVSGFPSGFWIVVRIDSDDWWSMIAYALYYSYFALTRDGRTIGKAALNLVVLTIDGKRLPRNELLLRELLKAALMPIAIISIIFALFREDGKALHDLLYDTLVFEEPIRRNRWNYFDDF